ncbi:MAG TPA: GDP-mannose 4,6-dehydratase, partial [Rhabdochlamydiaceae bacterium]
MKRSLLLFLFLITHCVYANGMDSSLEKKQVLVAGGAGFLGSHLCKRLLHTGCEVYCLDDLSTGFMRNIEPLMEDPHFHFIRQDVCLPVCLDVRFDEIYNLASPASPPHYQSDPVKTFQTNVLGAMNLLELARRSDAKIFQASTSEVYGDPIEHPQKENYWGNVNPIGIRACYDEGKRGAETLYFDYHRQYKTRIKVARIFNTYGPQMEPEDGRVVSNFIMQALEG